MNVEIPRKYRKFVEECVRSGKFDSEDEVAKEAFALLVERERLRADIDQGLADLKQGRSTTHTVGQCLELIGEIEAGSKALRGKPRKHK